MAYTHEKEDTLIGLFFAQAEKYKDDVFLRAKLRNGLPCDEWIDMTWSDVAREVRRMSAALIELGVEKDDRVGIFAHNRPRWIISDQAIQGSGGVGVPIYPTSTDQQLAFILNDSKAKGIITGDEKLMEQALRVKPDVPTLEFISCMAPLEDPPDACVMDYDALQKKGAKNEEAQKEFEKRKNALTLDDMVSIIYTSGTTGEPKGVVLTHSNFKAETIVLMSTTLTRKLLDRGIRLNNLCHLPLCHIMGRASDYHAQMAMAGTITFAESYNKVPENLLEVRPQMVATIPRLYEKVYEAVQISSSKMKGVQKKVFDWAINVGQKASDYMIKGEKMPITTSLQFALAGLLVYDKVKKMAGLNRVVMAASGGGALSKEVNKFFRSLNVIVAEGYGLTETTSAVSWNGPELINPMPDTWIYRKTLDWLIDTMVVKQMNGKNPFGSLTGTLKLVAVSNLLLPSLVIKPGAVGRPCKNTEIKIAEDGEVLVKGGQVFKKENGYFNRPDLTDEVFTEDGFFMTGDIGEFDEDGFLKITDRKKELIVTAGGKNIAPHPIELLLTNDTYIDQACAIGDARKYIVALVVPQFELIEKLAKEKGISYSSMEDLVDNPEIVKFYDEKLKEINQSLARYEQIKKVKLLPAAFSEETGELTPTLKMKRRIIHDKFNKEIESLY